MNISCSRIADRAYSGGSGFIFREL